MKNEGFDDWAPDQEIEYILTAKVNGEVAFKATDYDPQVITGQVRHAEEQVAQLLESQYSEGAETDWDAVAEDMRSGI